MMWPNGTVFIQYQSIQELMQWSVALATLNRPFMVNPPTREIAMAEDTFEMVRV